MFRGGRVLLQVFMLNHAEADYVLIKIRKQRGIDLPIILKYIIPVTTNFRILSYVQRRTRPPSVHRYLHVYFKKVTGKVLHFCLIKNPSEPYSEEDESSFKIHSFIVYA